MSEIQKLCKICDAEPLVDLGNTICPGCRTKLGIIPMPPPRRRAAPCLRCNATRFVRVIPREYTATGGDWASERVAPMTATVDPSSEPRLLFRGRVVHTPDIGQGHGLLEMYICSGCGFVEWYCHNPERIPIGPEYMTEVIDESSAPYR